MLKVSKWQYQSAWHKKIDCKKHNCCIKWKQKPCLPSFRDGVGGSCSSIPKFYPNSQIINRCYFIFVCPFIMAQLCYKWEYKATNLCEGSSKWETTMDWSLHEKVITDLILYLQVFFLFVVVVISYIYCTCYTPLWYFVCQCTFIYKIFTLLHPPLLY